MTTPAKRFAAITAERRRRPIEGISAVLLPYRGGRVDEEAFRRHLHRTLAAGLKPAVNMDTGFAELLTPEERQLVLRWTAEIVGRAGGFVAGALAQENGSGLSGYLRSCESISAAGGVPIVFPSPWLARASDEELCAFWRELGRATPRFLAFELGTMFNPNGRMFSERVLRALMEAPACAGLKHSSLDRGMEIERLELRRQVRPDFKIYSGNDLAADMIEFGSDYLLGLSTFAPELFALRDAAWRDGDVDGRVESENNAHAGYDRLRDLIQYLGWLGFCDPVPAYRHSAAIFLHLTGGLASDEIHPRALRREPWHREALADAARRVGAVVPT
jgi:dihydrodipicolinate synthase/N-acetylneuraminate lyase